MFEASPPAALAASLLFSGLLVVDASAPPACEPTYVPGSPYGVDDVVSLETTSISPVGWDVDPVTGGWIRVGGERTTATRNYRCVSPAWCSHPAYTPGGQWESAAWTKEEEEECSDDVERIVTPSPVPAPWPGTGCPEPHALGTDYDPDDLVSVPLSGEHSAVYRCKSAPSNLYCGMAGFEPGSGQHSSVAWDSLGSCTGSMAPTSSPAFETLEDLGICPEAYAAGAAYEEGARVSRVASEGIGLVYACKPYPLSAHCLQAGYEPGSGPAWENAWEVEGHCRGGATTGNSPLSTNPVLDFFDLSVEWVKLSERGPTISSHFLAHVGAALFDAWAAFELGTTGAMTELDGGVRVPAGTLSEAATARSQLYAMVDAAYDVITALGQTLLNQKYLEIDNGEDAEARRTDLMAQAEALRDEAFGELNLDDEERSVAQDVSAAVSTAILTRVTVDGSNYPGDYADTTGYQVRPWCEPVPVLTDPRTDYNFLDGSWVTTFNTYDAVLANTVPNPGYAQVHPLVLSGDLRLTDTYQSLTQHGIFPPAKDGGAQKPLTPHWGSVTSLSLPSSDGLRTDLPGPYDVDGNLREEWVEEHRDLVLLAHQQQDGNCWRCRAESEYWELGDEFPYPSGWWVQRAADIARDTSMGVKESLQLVFGVAITVFDAGIAAWEMKYHYDSVRPATTINEMFEGSEVSDWRGNRTANIDDKDHWRPYQLRRNLLPPFPEAPSGHSAFSTSSSVVLRNLLDTNVFDFFTEPFNSRFDLTDGFDGDSDNGNEDVVLEFKTFSQAADAAGFSRLYGGIHPMTGNVVGLNMGARVGHLTLTYLREIFGDDTLGRDPVVNVWDDIVFGTGKDDDLHADCVPGSLMEVHGFYGDDVLQVNDSGNCGSVSLFGGDGSDTFIINGLGYVTIQDYEAQDTIEIVQGLVSELGIISTSVVSSVTTVSVDGTPVVDVDGTWTSDELNIIFAPLRERSHSTEA